jgi:ABC-2 type transport system permease protein
MLNLISYLIDEDGIINTRSKEIKIRPLDKTKIVDERTYWQTINLVIPIIIMIGFGLIINYRRNRKYSVKKV